MRPSIVSFLCGLGLLSSLMACNEPLSEIRPPSAAKAVTQTLKDYVATPAGWYHRSCVHEIENASRVDKDGLVTRRDGTTYQIPKCLYRVYAAQPGTEPLSPADTGWIEYAYSSQPPGASYQQLNGSWTVPVRPLAPYSGVQVYYAFPGIESSAPAFILQPVLQYGYNGDFGGSNWEMASWHCDTGPGCTHSTPVIVSAGDAMYGSVASSNCLGGSCVWTVTVQDATTGQRSVGTWTDTPNYWWAAGGAVELRGSPTGLTSCDQYPINGVFYSGISLYDQNGSLLSPAWIPQIQSGTDPSCSFSVNSTTTSVSLYHNPASVPRQVA
jgi:hypothetical protein